MRSYSHLSEDERDQIGVLRAAGRSMGAFCPGARSGETTISKVDERLLQPVADLPIRVLGEANPARLADAFQPRRASRSPLLSQG